MTRFILTDGTKSIDLPQYPDSAWKFLTGAPEAIESDLYSRVAPVFRALNLYANVCANLPFALTKNGEDYDTSDDWQNKVGFLSNPRDLFRRWYMSLAMTNSAYGFMEGRGRVIKTDLRYLVPTSMTPVTASAFPYDLTGFKRTVGLVTKEYPLSEGRIIYIWRLDHTTELLPSKHTEFKALASAAGILYYSDFFIENYFMRGGVKPTIVAVKGQLSDPTKKDIESTWDKFVKNISKLRAKVINAEAIDIKPFGDGVADLKDSDIFREQCQKIAMAKGMPLSMLLSDYDNYSTAQIYDTAWFRDDVFPFCQWFAHEMNEQVFEPLGLKMEYRPEQTDEGTQDEVDRAQAYNTYIQAGIKPSIAAQIVGIELPQGVEYEDLDPEEEPEPIVEPDEEEVLEDPTSPQEGLQRTEDAPPTKYVISLDELREADLWQQMAFRKLKQGKSLIFPFEARTIPANIADQIQSKLRWANSNEDIKAAFELDNIYLKGGPGSTRWGDGSASRASEKESKFASFSGGSTVNDVPTEHFTNSGDKIKEDGFKVSDNSMYGQGVYFTSKTETSSDRYSEKVSTTLSPHVQAQLESDVDMGKFCAEQTGLDKNYLGSEKMRLALIDKGIGSIRFPSPDDDGTFWTLVLDPKLIQVDKVTKIDKKSTDELKSLVDALNLAATQLAK